MHENRFERVLLLLNICCHKVVFIYPDVDERSWVNAEDGDPSVPASGRAHEPVVESKTPARSVNEEG